MKNVKGMETIIKKSKEMKKKKKKPFQIVLNYRAKRLCKVQNRRQSISDKNILVGFIYPDRGSNKKKKK